MLKPNYPQGLPPCFQHINGMCVPSVMFTFSDCMYCCVLYKSKQIFIFLSSARTAEFTRVRCRFPGGETRVKTHLLTHKSTASANLKQCYFDMTPVPLCCWSLQWILIWLWLVHYFLPSIVTWKPPETHQASGAVGSAVKKRRRLSPGPIIVIKDEPDDESGYVSRK